MDENEKRASLARLVAYLLNERDMGEGDMGGRKLADMEASELFTLFRGLVNTRQPIEADAAFLAEQDRLLKALIAEQGIATADDATPAPGDPGLGIWRGDITTLAVGGIVNAANSQMLGCWQPGHYCIDNAIHTYAGVQLRLECAEIMRAQGHDEPTGRAKVTGAWNLPSRYVVHTVGPIAGGRPTDLHRRQLASSYTSCLDAAAEHGMESLAFCCISTGVFGFLQEEAAQIAVQTVRSWLEGHGASGMSIVFNVFLESDEAIYKRILGM